MTSLRSSLVRIWKICYSSPGCSFKLTLRVVCFPLLLRSHPQSRKPIPTCAAHGVMILDQGILFLTYRMWFINNNTHISLWMRSRALEQCTEKWLISRLGGRCLNSIFLENITKSLTWVFHYNVHTWLSSGPLGVRAEIPSCINYGALGSETLARSQCNGIWRSLWLRF